MNEIDMIMVFSFIVIVTLVAALILVTVHHWYSIHQLRREIENSHEIIRYNEMAYETLNKTYEQLRKKQAEDCSLKDS